MGVPKFFRFISERYPCLCELVKEYELPEFDNFYIDANGIIHNCSHPDDSVHFRISEEEIFKNIFHYLEMLFRLIKPKKLFFIAIDGVAPRAKMNQQRSRRFRTAKDAEKAMKEAVKKGETLPETERFDSNCITPGTVFMDKLHRQLQYFIKKKISEESLWQKPKIILSGHNVPGEGEHKIMDYIRYLRSQSDWDPNIRHCLHGLDADLIMLGLCTHELHFSLLREEVKFGKQSSKRKTNVEETKFYLLHLSLMRDYLDLEFQELKDKLTFPYDIECIIDDWVLMGFLIGNDFIPNLPQFHIANNALHILYKAYMDILPTLDGYINDSGTLNLERFQKYLDQLAKVDFEIFKDFSADLKYFESKTGKKFPGTDVFELDGLDEEIVALAKETDLMLGEGLDEDAIPSSYHEDSDESSDGDLREEFRMLKADFYKNKLEYETVDRDVLMEQAECYIRAIQWNLSYYYTGCPSWSWYYPHHYSPYVSDIKNFSSLKFEFGPSKPFLPFEQLLAVLPAASKGIVPEPFRDLMTSSESPIINFYPSDFETDLNGKQHDWEAVVLIPFIDENSLLSAMEPHNKSLTVDENERNSIKPMEIYHYTKENLGKCDAPEYFAPILNNHAVLTQIWSKDIAVDPRKVVKGRLPGAVSGAYLGFPHLSGISFTAKLSPSKVKVFEHPSRGDNMILKVKYEEITDEGEIDKIAFDLMGKVVFVGWPHIQRGKVTSLFTKAHQYRFDSGKVRKFSEKDMTYGLHSDDIYRSHRSTLGIELNHVDIVVHVKTVGDVRYQFEGKSAILDYIWTKNSKPFPYQTTLKQAPLLGSGEEIGIKKDLSEIFITGREVIILDAEKHYGSFGLVWRVTDTGNIEVDIEHTPELDLTGILDISNNTNLKYYPGSIASQRLNISSYLFSRVTGSIFIQNIENEEKLNIGLQLKFSKLGEELIDYTRKEGNVWLYSEKTISLLDDYMAKFPELFEYLEKNSGDDIFFNKDVFPTNGKEKIPQTKQFDKFALFKLKAQAHTSAERRYKEKIAEIRQWLKAQAHTSAERRPVGAKLLTNEAMKAVEKRILMSDIKKVLKRETVLIHPSKLYIPTESMGKVPPDVSIRTFLLDRIVAVRKNHNVPLGLKGTVIGFDKPNCDDALYDIIFDEPIPCGRNFACDDSRVYRLPAQAFVNVTQGRRTIDKTNMDCLHLPHLPHASALSAGTTNIQRIIVSAPTRQFGKIVFPLQKTPKKRMDFFSNNKDDNRTFPSPNTHESPNIHNIGNNAGKKFIDGFVNSGKITSPQGSRTFIPSNQHARRSGADFEFQAMWKKLQQNCNQPEELSLRPTVKSDTIMSPDSNVPAVAEEQTNALKKILRLPCNQSSPSPDRQVRPVELRPQKPPFNQQPLNMKGNNPKYPVNMNKFPLQITPGSLGILPQAKPCGHVTCTSDFVQICASKHIPYPAFKYNEIQSSGEILCTVSFQGDYGSVVSDACRKNEEAAENAACKAIRLIMQHDEKKQSTLPLAMGNYRLPRPGSRPVPSHLSSTARVPVAQSLNQFLTPKWCQTTGWSIVPPEKQQNKRPTPKGPVSPNQHPQAKPVADSPSNTEWPVERAERSVESVRVEQKALASSQQPQSGNQQFRSMTFQPSQQPPHYQRQPQGNRRPGGRPRPRIAANFSVPFKTDQHK